MQLAYIRRKEKPSLDHGASHHFSDMELSSEEEGPSTGGALTPDATVDSVSSHEQVQARVLSDSGAKPSSHVPVGYMSLTPDPSVEVVHNPFAAENDEPCTPEADVSDDGRTAVVVPSTPACPANCGGDLRIFGCVAGDNP